MKRIKILDDLTIQKIAAGEVIERPASVVKELVENSLDANSQNITLEIQNGGKSYIRVTDDGEGILENDLGHAFKPHSTSKLDQIDDLYNIRSFGFRGEALASIASVARVEMLTKTNSNLSGTQVLVEEGKIIKQQPIGCPKGTTMIVKDLFYNLPVRKNFLQSDRSEANKVTDIIHKLALGNYGTSFKYINDNRIIFNTSKNNRLKDNIYLLLGKEYVENLIGVCYETGDFKISGYISNNKFYRGNRSHQYLYVNKRLVSNQNISKIIEEEYKGLIPINRFPIYILFIDIDSKNIDVNIHPTKEEIKFINEQKIKSQLRTTIYKTLRANLSVPQGIVKKELPKEKEELPLLYEETLLDSYQGKDENNDLHFDQALEKMPIYKRDYTNKDFNYREGPNKVEKEALGDIFKNLDYIGSIFSTYILAENKQDSKVYIIDQHAAHERILYENYKTQHLKEKVHIQELLAPVFLELTNLEVARILENKELFREVGFVIDDFGNNSIIIRGVPILFGEPQAKSLFLEIIDGIDPADKRNPKTLIDRIIKIACSQAIKAGDRIDPMEVESLFQQLQELENPLTCPHGRPTVIEISKKDLEKEFKRII